MTAPTHTDGELQGVLDFLLRKKVLILAIALPIALATTMFALLLPNRFQSGISIFIEPQKVPQEYVRSTVTSDIEGRIRTISQQLTSRTRLLRVMEETNLYPREAGEDVSRDALVMRMAKDIGIELSSRRGDDSYFRVTFVHKDPRKAQAAVSRLVALFIDESLQVREQQAAGTTEFIEEELQSLKAGLERQEAAIQRFRQGNMGELPEQLDASLRMLDNLNLQLSGNLESQREMENRITSIEQEIARLSAPRALLAGSDPATPAVGADSLLLRREALLRDIARMEGSYTDRHPDLLTARRELARVDERLAASLQPATPAASAPAPRQETQAAGELANARRQLNDYKPRLAAQQEDERSLRERIALYQKRIESIPRREQELAGLTRDYENSKKNYEGLLSKKLDAQLSQNMEQRQKGEQFRVLDPANLPDAPFSPNRVKIIGLGLVGSLGAGLGFALAWEMLFPAFFSLRQLKARLDLPLVVGIPHLVTASETRRVRWRWMILAGAFLLAILAVHLFVAPLPRIMTTIQTNLKGTTT